MTNFSIFPNDHMSLGVTKDNYQTQLICTPLQENNGTIENSLSQLKHIMMRSTAIKSCDGNEQMVFAEIQEFRGRFHKKRKKQQEFLISE